MTPLQIDSVTITSSQLSADEPVLFLLRVLLSTASVILSTGGSWLFSSINSIFLELLFVGRLFFFERSKSSKFEVIFLAAVLEAFLLLRRAPGGRSDSVSVVASDSFLAGLPLLARFGA